MIYCTKQIYGGKSLIVKVKNSIIVRNKRLDIYKQWLYNSVNNNHVTYTKGGFYMSKRCKNIISAAVAAALCVVSVSVPSIDAGIIIDHDSDGITSGYYYDYSNSDENSKAIMDVMPNGSFSCEFSNEKDFSAVRGAEFAAPVEYSKLGDMQIRYWRRIELKGFNKDSGYVRFGIRLHNSDGNTFTILETDQCADQSISIEKNEKYKKIGTIKSYEILNDYTIFGINDTDKRDVNYTIYSYEDEKGTSFICHRDTPIPVNNYTDDTRKISISDKLNAIAAAGFEIGNITSVTWFAETSCAEGLAEIHMNELMIENMPELAHDRSEDEQAPLRIRSYASGTRNGYYYNMNCYDNSDMEVVSPSLFKSKWDNSKNTYEVSSVFERGKTFEAGQSYKAVAGSSVDFTMEYEAEGKFNVSTYAYFSGPETQNLRFGSELYIIDACSKEWALSQNAVKVGSITADENDYDVYYGISGAEGSFKPIRTFVYTFINCNAIKNGEKNKISVKHNLAPFVDYIHDNGAVLGSPNLLSVQFNSGISKGKAELTHNEIAIPDFIKEDEETKKAFENFDPDNQPFSQSIKNHDIALLTTGSKTRTSTYAINKTKCEWTSEYDLRESPFKFKQFTSAWNSYEIENSFNGYQGSDNIIIDYSIDMGEVSKKSDDSRWIIGSSIECNTAKRQNFFSGENAEDEYYGTTIVVADKWDGDPVYFFGNPYGYFADSEEPDETLKKMSSPLPYHDFKNLGTIVSDDVEYEVSAALPYNNMDIAYILISRKNALKAINTEDTDEGYKRYENTINASDIVNKLKDLGYDAGQISQAGASIIAYENTGSAIINHADVKLVPTEKAEYTSDDIKNLTDFLLGKKVEITEGTNYDINGDGEWDTFDLIAMKRIASGQK